jgi:nucleoside-diphosphate-sugar epimerase
MTERFTVLGGGGFIGARLIRHLREQGHAVEAPARDTTDPGSDPGHVIYAIGLTADFRSRPFDTMEAHVAVLGETLRRARFDSFLYLSSTRVYGGGGTGRETDRLAVDPSDPSDLYNLSKLAGEALCHAHDNRRARIARLSNVYDTAADGAAETADFLPSVIRAARAGAVTFATGPDSAKDYIRVDDACRALERIALSGAERCYNVAAGRNVANGEIAEVLARIAGCTTSTEPGAPAPRFPRIDTARIAALFAAAGAPWRPAHLIDDLPRLVAPRARRNAA